MEPVNQQTLLFRLEQKLGRRLSSLEVSMMNFMLLVLETADELQED